MKVGDFDEFCVEVIDKYIEEILAFESETNCRCLKVNKHAKRKILKFYQRKRDEIKDNYMEKNATSLDRHKVAACMIYAILRSKVLKVNTFVPHIPEKLLMANEYLAVYVAVNIIEQYRKEEGKKDSDYRLIFPITYHEKSEGDSDFINNICKSLYFLKWKILFFDVFAYSDIYFFLEKYTDTLIEHDSLNKEKGT